MTPTPNASSRLSSSDTLMLRIESDAVLRSPVVVIGLLDRVPSHAAVATNFERATLDIPRLRQRIEPGPLGSLRWVDDPDFAVAHHVRFARVAPHGSLRDVLDFAAPESTTPFDAARPPWEFTLVEGLAAGRAAFVLKFHHTITDGVGGVELARSLFDTDDDTVSSVTKLTHAAPVGQPAAEAPPRSPAPTAARLARLALSVGRMLAPVSAPLSPLFDGRGLDRAMHAMDVPLQSMRSAAHALDVTVNELFLTAVTGALHDYHLRYGVEVPALRFTMPISVRSEADAPGGNRFVPARFVMPIDEPDVSLRARLVAAAVRGQRHEPALRLADLLADGLALLPTPVVTRIFAGLLRNIDVDVVDVPGLEDPAFLAGARVTDMWAFAPPTGAALSITLLSHGPTCCLAVLSDTKAVTDPELLASCLEHAIAEVVAFGDDPNEDELPV